MFFRTVLDRLSTIPGVLSVAEATSFPPYSWGWTAIEVRGQTHSEPWGATFDMCSEGYFQTLDRHLLHGRLLSQSDVDSARHVTVINQTLARAYFDNRDPVGHTIKFSSFEMFADWPRDAYFEIIGVIGDAPNHGLHDPARPEAYFPYTLTGIGSRGIMLRSENSGPPLAAIRRAISAIDPDVALVQTGSIDSFLESSYYAGPRFTLVTTGAFAAVGLFLVTIGIFGVMSYTVSVRTREVGIRMALGAGKAAILKMILTKGLSLIAWGSLFGVLGSLALRRLLASQIWGVSPSDPWTLGVVAAIITVVGLVACWLPARRAARVDPLVALRYE